MRAAAARPSAIACAARRGTIASPMASTSGAAHCRCRARAALAGDDDAVALEQARSARDALDERDAAGGDLRRGRQGTTCRSPAPARRWTSCTRLSAGMAPANAVPGVTSVTRPAPAASASSTTLIAGHQPKPSSTTITCAAPLIACCPLAMTADDASAPAGTISSAPVARTTASNVVQRRRRRLRGAARRPRAGARARRSPAAAPSPSGSARRPRSPADRRCGRRPRRGRPARTPSRATLSAHSRPAGPAPTTATRPSARRSRSCASSSGAAGRRGSPGGARSGLTVHSSSGSNVRQSSLQATHGRISSRAALEELAREVGVGDQRARHADQVGAGCQGFLDPVGVAKGVRHQERSAHHGPQARELVEHRRPRRRHVAHVRRAHADRDVHPVHQWIHHAQQVGELVGLQRDVLARVDAQADAEQRGVRQPPDRFDHALEDRHPVAAAVGARRQELLEQIGVSGVELDAVEARPRAQLAADTRKPSTMAATSRSSIARGAVGSRGERIADGRDGGVVALGAQASPGRGARAGRPRRRPRRGSRPPGGEAARRHRAAMPPGCCRAGARTPAR